LDVGAGNVAYFALDQSVTVVAAHTAAKEEVAGVAHNMLLFVASEPGFVGLALFLVISFFAFKTVLATRQRSAAGTGILLGLNAFTIAGMTPPWEYDKKGHVLFGSVLSPRLRRSARRAPSLDRQECYR
jgi:O-antigen ligase